MAAPLGLHPRLVLALLRDRKDPLLRVPAGFGDDLHDVAIFPCDPPLLIPQNTIQAMLRRGLIEEAIHEGSDGRVAYEAHPSALGEAYSPEDAERHRATVKCWHRSYDAMVTGIH